MLNWIFPRKFWPGGRPMTMHEESRFWALDCPACGASTSVGAVGGIRYRAQGRGKLTPFNCRSCHKLVWVCPVWRPPTSDDPDLG